MKVICPKCKYDFHSEVSLYNQTIRCHACFKQIKIVRKNVAFSDPDEEKSATAVFEWLTQSSRVHIYTT